MLVGLELFRYLGDFLLKSRLRTLLDRVSDASDEVAICLSRWTSLAYVLEVLFGMPCRPEVDLATFV